MKDDENVLISYKGPINERLIMEMCTDIREKLGTSEDITQKIFSIFLELSRNILDYSADNIQLLNEVLEPVGLIMLNESEDNYSLTTGNLVKHQNFQAFKEKCDLINTLDRNELRQLKRQQRIRAVEEDEEADNTGIGLMRVALTANSPLNLEYVIVNDEYSFFTLSVNIRRK